MSSFLENWRAAGSPDPRHLSKNAVRGDRWDKRRFNDMLREMRPFNKERKALNEVAPDTGDGLWEDAFVAFNKWDPEIEDSKALRPDHIINKAIMSQAFDLAEYLRLKEWTTGDQVSSAAACISLRPDLERLHDRNKLAQKRAKELQKKLEELAKAEQDARDLDEMEEEWKKDHPDADENPDKQRIQDLIDALEGEASDIDQDLQNMMAGMAAGDKAILRKALGEAANQVENLGRITQMFGSDPGNLVRLSADKRLELARKLNTPKFRRMADLFGPLEQMMLSHTYREVNHMPQEVYDVTTGKDLEHVLPVEFGKLLNPLRKLEFYSDYTEGRLLSYNLKGEDSTARGGVAALIDTSGSMHGDRELWAKGLGLCLASLCQTQKREFRGILFSSSSEMMEFDFTKNFDVDKLIEFAEFNYFGGTSFQQPLSRALKRLTKEFDTTGRTHSDIVMITDGECAVQPQWEEKFHKEVERIGSTVWGILIGDETQGRTLRSITKDKIVTIKDILSEDSDLGKIFAGVRKTRAA